MVPPPLAASDAALFDSRCCLRSRVGDGCTRRRNEGGADVASCCVGYLGTWMLPKIARDMSAT